MLRKYILIVALVILISNAFVWSFNVPYNAWPDESAHVATAAFIYEKGHLPVFNRDMEATIDQALIYDLGINKIIMHTQVIYSSMPYFSYVLSAICIKLFGAVNSHYIAWYARIPSIMSYAVFLVGMWLFSVKLFQRNDPLRYLVPWFAANIPQVVFLASYTNNDIFSLAISIFVIYSWFLLHDGSSDKLPNPFFYGIVFGFLIFTKLNYYILIPLTLIAYSFGLLQKEKEFKNRIVWLSQVLAIGFAIGGWSLIRNYLLYEDPFGAVLYLEKYEEVRGAITPYDLGMPYGIWCREYLLKWCYESFQTSIAYFRSMHLPMPAFIGNAFLAVFLIALLGFFRHVWQVRETLVKRIVLYSCVALTVPFSVFMSLWNSYHVHWQPQGRYLYPAFLPFVLIFCLGLVKLLRSYKSQVRLSILVGGLVFVFNVYCLNGVIIPNYKNNPWYKHMRDTGKAWDYKAYRWE